MATYTYGVEGKTSGKHLPLGRCVCSNDDQARIEVGKSISGLADIFNPDACVIITCCESGRIISDLGTVEQVIKK